MILQSRSEPLREPAKSSNGGASVRYVHEIALSTQLASVVKRAAAGRNVQRVHLRIGAARQVVPQTLEYAWSFVSNQTVLAGSELDIDWVPVTLRCPEDHVCTLDAQSYFTQLCPDCQAPAQIIAGEEFTVIAIEVDEVKGK